MQLVNPRWRDSSITMMAATRLSFHDAHHHERSDFQERGLGAVLAECDPYLDSEAAARVVPARAHRSP
jgi:hypothetical protein